MEKDIHPFDLNRMLFGDAPPEFLIEALFRGLFLYIYMLFIIKLLGKRLAGELSIAEMVLVITLGSSAAVSMQVPEGGFFIGFVVLTCALLFERGLSWLTVNNKHIEAMSQGKSTVLIKDGKLQTTAMKDNKI